MHAAKQLYPTGLEERANWSATKLVQDFIWGLNDTCACLWEYTRMSMGVFSLLGHQTV